MNLDELEGLTRYEIYEPNDGITKEYNMKPREVRCYYCKYTIITSLRAPKCGICHSNLITFIPSLFED